MMTIKKESKNEKKGLKISQDKNREWIDVETDKSDFNDKRLQKRFKNLSEQLWNGLGKTIPFACQDWANTKAAYRFLSNEQVSEAKILSGHFQTTKERIDAQKSDWILLLQDTTEFSYHRSDPNEIGFNKVIPKGKDLFGNPLQYKTCGLLMHSSLAVTPDGLPLGLTAIKFWTRKQFKGCNALKKHVNPTRIPIEEKESYRWLENLKQSITLLKDPKRSIHIGDRESDIYELFCMAKELDTHFLVRICADRLIENGQSSIEKKMRSSEPKGWHRLELYDTHGNRNEINIEIRYEQMNVLPPLAKQKKYPVLPLTIIYAEEKEPPSNRDPIIWKLATNLPIHATKDAIEKLNWYAMRWKIETFHKILKSGCKAEELKLRAAQRLTNLIAIFCILSWRIFWMTMLNRCSADAPPELVLTRKEIDLIDSLTVKQPRHHSRNKNLGYYLLKIACLGGYLARKSDSPPGNTVMWRGMNRLADMVFGFNLQRKITYG